MNFDFLILSLRLQHSFRMSGSYSSATQSAFESFPSCLPFCVGPTLIFERRGTGRESCEGFVFFSRCNALRCAFRTLRSWARFIKFYYQWSHFQRSPRQVFCKSSDSSDSSDSLDSSAKRLWRSRWSMPFVSSVSGMVRWPKPIGGSGALSRSESHHFCTKDFRLLKLQRCLMDFICCKILPYVS